MRQPRWRRRLGDALFCLALALGAVSGGGAAALSGWPALADLFAPPAPSRVAFDINLPAERSDYGPRVLAPLQNQGFPPWLRARIAALQGRREPDMPAPPPVAAPSLSPAVAIVIDDLGPDEAGTRAALALPAAITLSFLPYGEATPALARAGAAAGHEVILHLPMQPDGHEDPGPMALLTTLPAAENLRRLAWALARVPEADGINNHMGSRFTADRAALVPVLERVAAGHDFFLDSRTAPDSQLIVLARAFGILSAGRDVFLDDVQSTDEIRRRLEEAVRIARADGTAIVIGHPHPATLATLRAWLKGLDGVTLIPLREAMRRKTAADLARLAARDTPPPALAGSVE